MQRFYFRLLLFSLSAAGLSGCGGPRVYKVNPDVARQTLTKVLDHWKSGATPESLQTAKPSIIVQDADWAAGAKLTGYEVTDPGESRDANLIVKVKLTLTDRREQEVSKDVKYLISTAPVLTMHRYMFD